MNKKKLLKLQLSRETLEVLQREDFQGLKTAGTAPTPDSQCPIPPCVPQSQGATC